jgi:homocitrate synthase NifV
MGLLRPSQTHLLFRRLCAETDLELVFRGHEDCGLATANTLAAVTGGATHVSANALEDGAAGHARCTSLAEVAAAIRGTPPHHTRIEPARLSALSAMIARTARVPSDIWRPHRSVLGKIARAHAALAE